MFGHKHDWGLWRWQVDYITDKPSGFLIGKWIRYCKRCAGFQYDEVKTDASLEKYRKRYLKKHYPNTTINIIGG